MPGTATPTAATGDAFLHRSAMSRINAPTSGPTRWSRVTDSRCSTSPAGENSAPASLVPPRSSARIGFITRATLSRSVWLSHDRLDLIGLAWAFREPLETRFRDEVIILDADTYVVV